MKITIRLFASLRQGREKQIEMEFKSEITPAEIIEHINIKPEQVSICMINGQYDTINRKLKDGDIVSLLPPVGGG